MGNHFHSNSEDSQYNHNHYTVPTSYSSAASFTVNDLGSQYYYDGQSTQRGDSLFSSTDSPDSASSNNYGAAYMYRDNSQSSSSTGYNSAYSPLDVIQPTTLYGTDIAYFATPVDNNCLMQPASNAECRGDSYAAADWMTPRISTAAPYQQTGDLSISPLSPGMQQNGSQGSQPAKYPCLICLHSFRRPADLQRHYTHMHNHPANRECFHCDYKQCLRSESGYRLALERMGQQSAHEKIPGIGPFGRKDHYKAHLRDQHQEALPKRDPKSDPGWSTGKIMKEEWWRCVKCLKRVWIQKQRDEKRDEYVCCNCGAPCDAEMLKERQARFRLPLTSTSALTSSSSRKHKH